MNPGLFGTSFVDESSSPIDIVRDELTKLLVLLTTDPVLNDGSDGNREFHAKLSHCLANCETALQKRDQVFVSDLLSVIIRCMRHFAERGNSDDLGCLPYLTLFTLLHVLFEKFIGPVFSETATVVGLQSEQGQTLNGLLVSVQAFDPTTGRFCVRISANDPKKDWKRLKAENLQMRKADAPTPTSTPQSGHRDETVGGATSSTNSPGTIKNAMGLNCLESIADVYDFILQDVVYLADGREAILGKMTCRAMWRTLTSCIGGAGAQLTGADTLELCGNDPFRCCLLIKSILVSEPGVVPKLGQLWAAHEQQTGDGARGEEEGSLQESILFKKKLAQAFVDTDLLPELNQLIRQSCAACSPQIATGQISPNTSAGGAAGGSSGSFLAAQASEAANATLAMARCLAEVARVCQNDRNDKHMIRHVIMNGKEFVILAQQHVLDPWFRLQMNPGGPDGAGGGANGATGGAKVGAGVVVPPNGIGANVGAVSTSSYFANGSDLATDPLLRQFGYKRVSIVLEAFLKLKLLIPELELLAVPPYAPYLPSFCASGRLVAKCLLLTLGVAEYADRESVMQKIRTCEGQVFFGSPVKEKLIFYKTALEYLVLADHGATRQPNSTADDYWEVILGSITAEIRNQPDLFGDTDFEEPEEEFEGEAEAIRL